MRLVLVLLLSSLASAQGMGGKSGIGGKAGFGGGVAVAGSPTVAQSANCTSPSTTACNITLTSVIAGHRVFVFCGSTGACSTPTMTGETFTAFTGASGCLNNTGDVVQCWLVQSAVGGQTTIACTSAAANIMCEAIDLTDPQNLATPKDAGGNSQNAANTSFTVSTSATTSVASDIVIACIYSAAVNSSLYVVGGGYTSVDIFGMGGGNSGEMLCEQATPGSTGTQTATATNASSARGAMVVLAIKP